MGPAFGLAFPAAGLRPAAGVRPRRPSAWRMRADAADAATPQRSLAVRRRLADRWREEPPDDSWLADLAPDLRRLVLAMRATGRWDYVPSAASAAISRALRTLERRGLVRRLNWLIPRRVHLVRSNDPT